MTSPFISVSRDISVLFYIWQGLTDPQISVNEMAHSHALNLATEF